MTESPPQNSRESHDAASRCVYRTWFGPIHKLARLERWVTPSGIEYRLIEVKS